MADQATKKTASEDAQSEDTPLLAKAPQGGHSAHDIGTKKIRPMRSRIASSSSLILLVLVIVAAAVAGTAYYYRTKRYKMSSTKAGPLDDLSSSSVENAGAAVPLYLVELPDTTPLDSFPDQFVWGVATSAYQIEGATNEDGRGPSVWDVFVQQPGTVLDGATGDIADDHYHLWHHDVNLMADELGVKAYRFSISWSRILPSGRGEINPKGIQFYDHLIDALLERNIEPWITLFHWDLPQALQDDFGGWMDSRTIDAFEEYSRVIFHHFAHKVKHFITLNEPWT
jgi:Glycosyl hydrolase family 1